MHNLLIPKLMFELTLYTCTQNVMSKLVDARYDKVKKIIKGDQSGSLSLHSSINNHIRHKFNSLAFCFKYLSKSFITKLKTNANTTVKTQTELIRY